MRILLKAPIIHEGDPNKNHRSTYADKGLDVSTHTKRLPNGLYHHTRHEKGSFGGSIVRHTISRHHDAKEPPLAKLGGVMNDDGDFHVTQSGVNSRAERRGYGRQLYAAALLHHGNLSSDTHMSRHASNAYHHLGKHMGIEFTPGTEGTDQPHKLKVFDKDAIDHKALFPSKRIKKANIFSLSDLLKSAKPKKDFKPWSADKVKDHVDEHYEYADADDHHWTSHHVPIHKVHVTHSVGKDLGTWYAGERAAAKHETGHDHYGDLEHKFKTDHHDMPLIGKKVNGKIHLDDGHHRLAIARKQKMTHVHVIVGTPKVKKAFMLFKAKTAAVGTIRKRKAGSFLKTKPGHWKMLKEIVRDEHTKDGVHANHETARLMQSAAARLARHLKNHDRPNDMRVAHAYLDKHFDDGDWGKGFEKWKRRVLNAVTRYSESLKALETGDNVRAATTALQQVRSWQERSRSALGALRSDTERDAWVAKEFAKAKKPIGHLIFTSRAIIGYGVPLTTVDGGFKGLCKAIIEKAYEHGPSGYDEAMMTRFDKAFKTFFEKAVGGTPRDYQPLAKALTRIDDDAFFKANPKWFVYCCTRQAMKNEGVVDIGSIKSYMGNAMRKHKGKTPPRPDYDDPHGSMASAVKLGLTRPADAMRRLRARITAPDTSVESLKNKYSAAKRMKKGLVDLFKSMSRGEVMDFYVNRARAEGPGGPSEVQARMALLERDRDPDAPPEEEEPERPTISIAARMASLRRRRSPFPLFKARALPVGSKRKWADGTYIKGSDHRWHREMIDEHALTQLKADGKHRDKEMVEEFTEGVHSYVEHLHGKNLHPLAATPDTDAKHWEGYFDEKDWYDNPGYLKYAKKVRAVAVKVHTSLVKIGKDEEKAEAKEHAVDAKKTKVADAAVKKIKSSGASFVIKDRLSYDRARVKMESRNGSLGFAIQVWDGKTISRRDHATALTGFTVQVAGVKGVVMSYRFYRETKALHSLRLMTATGEHDVTLPGGSAVVKIIADPESDSADKRSQAPKSLAAAGIDSLAFDADISHNTKVQWNVAMQDAFADLGKKLDLHFGGRVRIHVYGSRGPKRGATADYSSKDKVIRLSTAKSGSKAALAHELGHALDDKMNGWHGTGSYDINELVQAFRKTPQGRRELDNQSDIKKERNAQASLEDQLYGILGGRRRKPRRRALIYANWQTRPEEIFARCFETYIAKHVPSWKSGGWAKAVIDDESFKDVEPILKKLLAGKKVKKALSAIFGEMRA